MHHLNTQHARRRRVLTTTALGLTTVVLGSTAVAAAVVPAPASASTVAEHTAKASAAPHGGPAPDPQVLYSEGFEHDTTDQWIGLEDYVGAEGERYTADPAWLDHDQCNGIILDGATTDLPSSCGASSLRALATALGTVGGSADPKANHVVSAWTTDKAVPKGAVQAESVQTSKIKDPGRFISFGVNAAAAACTNYVHPLLNFALIDGEVERPVSDHAIDPCTDAASKDLDTDGVPLRGGSFVSKGGLLFDGDAIRWVMRNEQTSPSGNDGAIDQVTVYDSTPQLRADLTGDDLIVGDTARLTFTVLNTSEAGSKPGWSFEDGLPDALRIADQPNVATTCANGTVEATAGGHTVQASGDLRNEEAACTIALDITTTTPGNHTLDASSVTTSRGLEDAVDTKIAFAAEHNALTVTEEPVLTGGNGDAVADLGEQLAFRVTVTNAGNVAIHDLAVTSGQDPTDCVATSLPVGASTTCTTAARAVTQDDVDAGRVDDSVTVSAASRLDAAVGATASASVPTTPAAPALGLEARPTSSTPAAVGDEVDLEAVVTNTGNVTLHDASVEAAGRDLPVACPSTTLAPGASVTCATTTGYRVEQTDVDNGGVTLQFTSAALPPSGDAVTAAATTDVRTQHPAAALEASLSASHDDLHVGEPIALRGTVRNTGNVTVHDLSYAVPGRPELAPACDATELTPGASTECVVGVHEVTQADVDAGRVDVAAVVSGAAPDGTAVRADASTSVEVPRHPALGVTASANLAASEHEVPEAGDLVERSATVRNDGDTTLTAVTATIGGDEATCAEIDLAPGAETVCRTEDSALTQGDVDAGALTVPVTADAVAPDSSSVEASDRVRVGLTGRGGLDVQGAITTSTDEPLRPGATVDASFTVRNTGNRTVDSLAIESEGLDSAVPCGVDELAPGATTTCATETPTQVTSTAASAGELELTARAKGRLVDVDGAADESVTRSGLVVTPGTAHERPTWVFSPWFSKQLRTEPAPTPAPTAAPVVPELAFTGSTVLAAVPLAVGGILVGVLLWGLARRRRSAPGHESHDG
ncbi:hypothetical protein [Curtobacterium sp. P97]|uniref:DUF7507 domain-containing protein n=1 Tax=Curtobacterium sp. P97 TaxID=2939562 RepID=UPI0020419838|nr:hypothetical protein [Curtobacterium sp. P97]MCM3522261.1 hypothetical protein [Curtobacterium sp. P97]